MPAGAKTEQIAIERSTETRRPGGAMTVVWSEIGRAWAHAQWVRGGESDRQGAVRYGSVYKFTCWAAAVEALALTPKDRVVWNGDRYNIRERPVRLPAKPDIEIVAESGVAQ